MAVPEGRTEIPRFQPPAWMVRAAQNSAKLSGVGPEALAKRMQEAKEERGKVNVSALAKKIAEIKETQNLSAFNLAERPKAGQEQGSEVSEEQGSAAQTQAAVSPTIEPKVITRIVEDKRKTQVDKQDKRRAKKEKVRTKQTKEPEEMVTPAPRKEPTSSVFAESSATGARREAAASVSAAADAAEPMDLDILPTRDLFVSEHGTDRYPVPPVLPAWYTSITGTEYRMKEINKRKPPALVSLDALKNCAARCSAAKKQSELKALYEELRDHVHKAEIALTVDKFIVKKANMLSPVNGLPRIFKEDADFPADLKADSYQLYNRWYRADFEQDILRGILTIKGKDRNGDRIDPAYRAKFPTDAKYYGQGDLVLGQWWPTQLCTVRDGAHGCPQGGIYGEREKGAYSIVLSGGTYQDQDDGDTIEYSGTEGKNFTPTENTNHLILSQKLGNPVRVIRSAQLAKKSRFRPEIGLRYDGLYQVKSYEVVDEEKAMYRFCLERCWGQEPIRYEGAARRPTVFEIREYDAMRAKKGW
ncbi:hypothetical protein EJ02DRAFT_452252 [Clathrospora elynae]|uniref:YDG domain-containing protein n=1 Tax=Clathrospora elynae TaxID=706981 RepID=A0A6A5T1R4_9PLEO|nr:hypothetical protein EJ02DRAFT_452252 [Clathrospora elynae]